VYSTPLLIYVGTITPDHYLAALASQLIWGAVFGAASVFVWRGALKRVVVQGG
jgi:ABC-2 type transport system permease protein